MALILFIVYITVGLLLLTFLYSIGILLITSFLLLSNEIIYWFKALPVQSNGSTGDRQTETTDGDTN